MSEALTFTSQAWAPTVFTPPLSDDFPTMGDRCIELMEKAWITPEGGRLVLDEWQKVLIRHALEVYPDGHARAGQYRYRQVLISLARQNGKSVLGGVLALWGLVSQRGPEVISVASTVEQANIVFKRVKYVIDANPVMRERYRTTSTRGISSKMAARHATYVVKTNKEDALQGLPVSTCIFDEVHICPEASWDAVVFGTTARQNGQIIGITTAGDDKSVLLKRLYETGRKAVASEEDMRFGFFLWEAPGHLPVDHPDALIAANPAIASGRLDLEQELGVVRTMPEAQARRYRLNQFVSSESSWITSSLWTGAPKGTVPDGGNYVVSVARAQNWTHATVTVSAKVDGVVHTEVAASLVHPTLDQLEDVCVALRERLRPKLFLMESVDLKDLAMRLRERGYDVEYLTAAQMLNVCATAYAVIAEGKVVHAHDPVVDVQVPRGVAKNAGEGWRISRRDSVGDVDALMATVIGLYGAETLKVDLWAAWVSEGAA